MIGIFLVTHGTLGEALIQCACHVLNKRPPQIVQLGLSAQDDPLDILPQARQMLGWADSGYGVLVMTDIFGATPGNVAAKLIEPGRVEAIAGVNLPMLLRVLTYRERDMDTLLKRAVSGGCELLSHDTQTDRAGSQILHPVVWSGHSPHDQQYPADQVPGRHEGSEGPCDEQQGLRRNDEGLRCFAYADVLG